MTTPPSNTEQLLDERQADYGNSHEVTGCLLRDIQPQLAHLLSHYPVLWFPWLMIFNKLIRALTSPTKIDHWADIQGYAELALRSITELRAEARGENNDGKIFGRRS